MSRSRGGRRGCRMCLIVLAWRLREDAPLLLAANRDEFHARPSAAADFWTDEPGVLAGRDLRAGGTWLGLGRGGRFATITNIRDPDGGSAAGRRSRGELVTQFLTSGDAPEPFLRSVAARVHDYQGFNLLLSDGGSLWYLHGVTGAAPRRLAPGLYGLSNATLDVPWPKVCRARRELDAILHDPQPPGHRALAACLASRAVASESELHGHGLVGAMAQPLSAQFIVTPTYGTRCCTTLRWLADGRRELREESFDAGGHCIATREFALPPGSDWPAAPGPGAQR